MEILDWEKFWRVENLMTDKGLEKQVGWLGDG
jgi:hypothetical protein